jgi:hypothetical protein
MRHACANQRNQQWQNINLKRAIISNSLVPPYWIKHWGYMDCLIKEAIEIRLHPRNFNRDGDFNISWSWHPVTDMIKQYRDEPIQRRPGKTNL